MWRRVPLTLFLVVLASGLPALACDPRSEQARSPDSDALSEFQDIIRRDGAVTFRSWDGKAFRRDSDTEFAFFAEGKVEILEYGFGLFRYAGSYEIREHGQIAVNLAGLREDWPDMKLEREASTLVLKPVDSEVGFVMGNRGGAVVSGDGGSYWPFREVTGRDKREILDTLEELRRSHHEESY